MGKRSYEYGRSKEATNMEEAETIAVLIE